MAIATEELDRTDRRHPAAAAPRPLPSPRAARRPATLEPAGTRAATRAGGVTQVRRRRAAVLALLVIAVVALGLVLPSQPPAGAADGGAPSAPVLLVVAPGETVWGLVAPHAPAGVPLQAYVAHVLARNGLDATAIAPGTVVRLD
jgi:hypothetical protein